MKSPTQILDAVRARITASWHLDVCAASSTWPHAFELGSPSQSELEDDFAQFERQAEQWQRWAADHGLELTSSLRRVSGSIQSLPTHVSLTSLNAAVDLIGGEWPQRVERGRAHAALLRTRFPGVPGLPTVVRAVDNFSDTDFDLLCAAARWFRQEPASGLTVRQVPIEGLSRAWVATNGALIIALAGIESLGLVELRPQRIHFSYLDPDHLSEGGRRFDSAAVGDIAEPAYRPDFVLISENADTALQIPTLSLAISVEGAGSAGASAIASFDWIADAGCVVYWGDVDAASLEIVNQLRVAGLEVHSILMDIATYDTYTCFGTNVDGSGNDLRTADARRGSDTGGSVAIDAGRTALPRLTGVEQQLYSRLTDPQWEGPRRIEQERIPLSAAAQAIAKVLAARR